MAEYREVVIVWNDEPEEDAYLVTVVVDGEWNELEDDPDVFFYFSNEAEFEQAKTGEGYEFTIIEWEG